MTIVNLSSVFQKWNFREWVEEISEKTLDSYTLSKYNEILGKSNEEEIIDYRTIVRNQREMEKKLKNLSVIEKSPLGKRLNLL